MLYEVWAVAISVILGRNVPRTPISNIWNSSVMQDVVRTDLDAAQIPIPEFGGTYVHRGFYDYAISLWKNKNKERRGISEDIKILHQGKKIYVCGHSLGASAALILSALIQEAYKPKVLRLHSYGSPRTGTKNFVMRYANIVHYRHVNGHDLVAQIPMKWMNTDITEGFDPSSGFIFRPFGPLGLLIGFIPNAIQDNNNDNYLHHGALAQLLSVEGIDNKNHQLLLTPRQTQVSMLDLSQLSKQDATVLVDNFFDISLPDHGLDAYIPNLFGQLKALSHSSLHDNYHAMTRIFDDEIAQLLLNKKSISADYNKTLDSALYSGGFSGVPNIALRNKLKGEKKYLDELLENVSNVREELIQISNDPVRFPLAKLFMANKALPDVIKEQITDAL